MPKPKGSPKTGGRKSTGSKMRSFRLTDEQYKIVKNFIRELKKNSIVITKKED